MRQRGGSHLPGLLVQLDVSEPGGAVDADEKIQFAFRRLNLGNINVEVAERVGLELRLGGLVALDLGEARDVVALQTAVQRRAGQVRDRRLQGIETIVQRQQRVPAKRDDDGLLSGRQHGRLRVLRTCRQIGDRGPLAPLGHGLLIDPVAG